MKYIKNTESPQLCEICQRLRIYLIKQKQIFLLALWSSCKSAKIIHDSQMRESDFRRLSTLFLEETNWDSWVNNVNVFFLKQLDFKNKLKHRYNYTEWLAKTFQLLNKKNRFAVRMDWANPLIPNWYF